MLRYGDLVDFLQELQKTERSTATSVSVAGLCGDCMQLTNQPLIVISWDARNLDRYGTQKRMMDMEAADTAAAG